MRPDQQNLIGEHLAPLTGPVGKAFARDHLRMPPDEEELRAIEGDALSWLGPSSDDARTGTQQIHDELQAVLARMAEHHRPRFRALVTDENFTR